MQIHIIHITYYIYWCNLNLVCLKIGIILEVFTLIIPYFINLPFQRNLTANRHFQLIKGCNPIFDVSVDLTSTLIKGCNPILVSSRLITYTIVKECNPIRVVASILDIHINYINLMYKTHSRCCLYFWHPLQLNV